MDKKEQDMGTRGHTAPPWVLSPTLETQIIYNITMQIF